MIPAQKQILRREMRAALAAMPPESRKRASTAIANLLIERLQEMPGALVLGFAPIRTEPDWLAALNSPTRFAFPRVEGDVLPFFSVKTPDDLAIGAFGIREPVGSEEVDVAAVKLILVPGLAFDASGHRLGRGGGFYDRLLACPALNSVRRVAVCFERQVVEAVPAEPHDQSVDELLTEVGWRPCGDRAGRRRVDPSDRCS